jgi:hypothetical protein
MSVSITQILQMAKATGYEHHPMGVMVWRTPSNKWCAKLITSDTQATSTTVAKPEDESPEAALVTLATVIRDATRTKIARAENEAKTLRAAIEGVT